MNYDHIDQRRAVRAARELLAAEPLGRGALAPQSAQAARDPAWEATDSLRLATDALVAQG